MVVGFCVCVCVGGGVVVVFVGGRGLLPFKTLSL